MYRMTDEESEFEPKVLGAFEKSHQTSLILNNLISLPITATPSPDEDKLEAEQLRQLIQTVKRVILTYPLYATNYFLF